MIDAQELATQMIGAAQKTAGAAWADIQEVARHEFEIVAQRVTSISLSCASGEMKQSTAQMLMRTVQSQIVAVLAMLSTLVLAAAQKIVTDALNAIKAAVNAAAGFTLIAV